MVILFRQLLILFVCLLSSKVFSADDGAEVLAAASPVSTSNMIFQVLIALAIVTAAILALAWVVKRLGNTHLLQHRDLKILSTMPLGTREKVILIEVENQKILLGVTPSNISSLHVFNTSEENSGSESGENKTDNKFDRVEPNSASENEKWDFTRYFKKVVGDNKGGGNADSDLGGRHELIEKNSPELVEMKSPELAVMNSAESELVKSPEHNPELIPELSPELNPVGSRE